MSESDFYLPTIEDGEDKTSPLTNCIRNHYRHVRKWAKRTITNCFRLYDRDIHSYPVAIDYYGGRFCVHYFAKSKDSEEPPPELVVAIENSLSTLFNVGPEVIYWRTRAKSKETRQYEKADLTEEFFTVIEYGVKFKVNLRDYLDTGLFMDHRETRQLVARECKGKRLLNLFAYTGSFSVQAAIEGAVFTKSVDMSNTYCDWAKDNFALNGFTLRDHPVVRADCMKFLVEEGYTDRKYDRIVIDPPTISRSKKMDQLFDIQVDYIFLISKCLALLASHGLIFFSTNSRKFVLDETLFPKSKFIDISHQTIPFDFHDPKMHRCWKIKASS